MSNSIEAYVVEGDNIVIDNILWRRFRRQTPGLVEKTLDLNPGLAGMGAFIPHGTLVLLPIEAPSKTRVVPVIKLWD